MRHTSKDKFVQLLHGAPLLLVHVRPAPDGDETFLRALEASTSRTGNPVPPSPDGLPFQTMTAAHHAKTKNQPLRERGLTGVLCAVVLHKRTGSQTLSEHRICVGRSRNTDIVLREPSVSKLQAWFERDDDGNYFLTDASSHNGTWVNGESLPARKARCLTRGDTVHFGSVESMFCGPGDFWDAIVEAL